ncbi:MAG: hypothetical protein ABSE83_09775 [Methanobacterium sp.]|jgi:hypothetical protein
MVDLNQNEIQELQEKLILIYKFINQERMYEKFFFEGLDTKKSFKTDNKLINKLLEMKDPEEFLETCIIELEELKTEKNIELEDNISLYNILEVQDFENLYNKYGMVDMDDVDKLDINKLLDFI